MKRTNLDSFQMEELSGQKAPQYVYPLLKKMRRFNAYLCLERKMFFHNLFRPCHHLIVNTDKDNKKQNKNKKNPKVLVSAVGQIGWRFIVPALSENQKQIGVFDKDLAIHCLITWLILDGNVTVHQGMRPSRQFCAACEIIYFPCFS